MIDHIEFTVIGTPAPQGSKSFKGLSKSGRGILVESSKAVKPWREAVKYEAWAWVRRNQFLEPRAVIVGPVSLSLVFTMPRPKSAKVGALPDKKPDLSKLVRSTEDAITDAGLWEDDSRVVALSTCKLYVGDDGAMPLPGALISIRRAS